MPEITAEIGYFPQWMGFGTPPDPDPYVTTYLQFSFDSTQTPHGVHGEQVNENNIIYAAMARSPPTNSLGHLLTEFSQASLGFRSDYGSAISDDIFYHDDEGNPHFNEFVKTMFRILVYFDP